MFLIFKIFPDWLFYLLLLAGILCFFASYLKSLITYDLILKSVGLLTIAGGIFLLGMLHADNTWKAEARVLEARAEVLATESRSLAKDTDKNLATSKQQNRDNTRDIVQFIDNTVKGGCELPQEVLQAHNKAAK